jgi:hypothetical protein
MPMKSCLRFWNWKWRFALVANCLDGLAAFLPNSASLSRS